MFESIGFPAHKRKSERGDFDNKLLVPVLAETGEEEREYKRLHKKYEFENEEDLVKAGQEFVKLHRIQKEKGEGKAKQLALTLSITPTWAFAAGLLQEDEERLKKLFSLPDLSDRNDPLKSEILSNSRGEDDPQNYRGMATRYGIKERGRLLKLFLIYSKSKKENINKDMVKLAIEDYHDLRKGEKKRKLAERVY